MLSMSSQDRRLNLYPAPVDNFFFLNKITFIKTFCLYTNTLTDRVSCQNWVSPRSRNSDTRWNSTYLMLQRFLVQYPAILAASFDERVKQKPEFQRLHRVSDVDISNIESYIDVMQLLYQVTVVMCSEKKPTAGMILPMIAKLQANFVPCEQDEPFRATPKKTVWNDLKKRYQLNDA